MRSLLSVLAFAYVLLAPAPALSQTPQDEPSAAGAQYDQYSPINTPVGPETADRAVRAATAALDAIQSSAEEAQAEEGSSVSAAELPRATDLAFAGGAAFAGGEAFAGEEAVTEDPNGTAEAQDESPPDLQKLPDTGGPSPLWLAAPLLCAGGLLARKILI